LAAVLADALAGPAGPQYRIRHTVHFGGGTWVEVAAAPRPPRAADAARRHGVDPVATKGTDKMASEYWLHGFPIPGQVVDLAVRAEEWGLDGLLLADSELLVGDPYIELTLAARSTSRLRLGPAVTNPVTRHAAVTAAAVATLQVESAGRAVAVLGRGDSAVLQLGLSPARSVELRQYVTDVRTYLAGGQVSAGPGLSGTMSWYPPYQQPPVPISVAATGPATIRLAARYADGVELTVGADPERIRWGIGVARAAADASEREPHVGAWLNFAINADQATARNLVRGSAAIFAHFVSEGPLDVLSADDRSAVEPLRTGYVERDHGLGSAKHTGLLPDEFVDRFAVVGPPHRVVERLRQLADLGVDRFILVPASRDADPALVAQSNELLAREVLPHLR
jgi:5,10-methylenetetrahydromethanopterin reductase